MTIYNYTHKINDTLSANITIELKHPQLFNIDKTEVKNHFDLLINNYIPKYDNLNDSNDKPLGELIVIDIFNNISSSVYGCNATITVNDITGNSWNISKTI